MRTVSFVVPDPPPLREDPGRGAGIESPYAKPLVAAARATVGADPDAFPFQFQGMVVRYGRTVWNVNPLGYQPDHSILEVLVGAGAVWDPSAWWTRSSQDPTSDYYVVTFTTGDGSEVSSGIGPIQAWTEVPQQFRGT